MAYSKAAIASWESAALVRDCPMMLAQVIPISPSVARWTEVGATSSTDRTLAGYPVRRAYDNQVNVRTKTDTTVSATWYLVFDFGATGIEFDAVGLFNHNFGTLSLTTCTFEVADAADFGTNLETAADFSAPSDDKRLLDLSLASGRYSTVRYARLKLSKGANFTPELGELLLLRRYQLAYNPENPYDKISLHDEASIVTTQSGIVYKTIYYQGRFELRAPLRLADTTQIATVSSWFTATRNTFVWVNNPTTAPTAWNLMIKSGKDLDLPSEGWVECTTNLLGIEQGPEDYYLSKGLY